MQEETRSNKITPDKLNYDAPIIFRCVSINEEHQVVTEKKLALQWINIQNICEYPTEYGALYKWGKYKDEDKVWIQLEEEGESYVVLANFDDLLELWEYYLRNVRLVEQYQVPNYRRKPR